MGGVIARAEELGGKLASWRRALREAGVSAEGSAGPQEG